jgi:hypothetical protein
LAQNGQQTSFEILPPLPDTDIMTITRFFLKNASRRDIGGEEVNRQVIKFEKGLNNTILMRSVTYVIIPTDEGKPMAQAVKKPSTDPIIGSFDILAIKKDLWKTEVAYVIRTHTTYLKQM